MLYDYEADPSSLNTSMKELSVKVDEVVIVLESGPQNNGWCYVMREERTSSSGGGSVGTRSEGWVPEDYLESEETTAVL